MYRIFHNPRCRKSRETLALLKEKTDESQIEIIEYLTDTPSESELKRIVEMLNIPAEKLLRKNEDEFKPYKGKKLSDAEWISIMHQNPKLIERPIVIKDNKAILGRPPENVLQLIP